MAEASKDSVVEFYNADTAAMYNDLMDSEMSKYSDDFERLVGLAPAEGSVVDTAAGSGHHLEALLAKLPGRVFVGRDLSPEMIAVARERLPESVAVVQADMTDMTGTESSSCAVLLNTFALHHVSADTAKAAIAEWARCLGPGGVLYLATWEGVSGTPIEGVENAYLWSAADVTSWIEAAGLRVDHQRQAMEAEFEMNTLYVLATKTAAT